MRSEQIQFRKIVILCNEESDANLIRELADRCQRVPNEQVDIFFPQTVKRTIELLKSQETDVVVIIFHDGTDHGLLREEIIELPINVLIISGHGEDRESVIAMTCFQWLYTKELDRFWEEGKTSEEAFKRFIERGMVLFPYLGGEDLVTIFS